MSSPAPCSLHASTKTLLVTITRIQFEKKFEGLLAHCKRCRRSLQIWRFLLSALVVFVTQWMPIAHQDALKSKGCWVHTGMPSLDGGGGCPCMSYVPIAGVMKGYIEPDGSCIAEMRGSSSCDLHKCLRIVAYQHGSMHMYSMHQRPHPFRKIPCPVPLFLGGRVAMENEHQVLAL